jgi:phosphoribosylaminoimidazolecarboxamide formyltransferase/IMP cyclohydrolase
MRALISVYDKTGIVPFAAALSSAGWEIISTGGTLRALLDAGIPAVSVSEITGFPEILDGRVKTLHPAIHGGLLGRPGLPSDASQLAEHRITPIDLLAVNLYPFAATIARPDVTEAEAIEQIDIGGPAMLRASAKNHEYVLPVVDPADYEDVLERLASDTIDRIYRRRLAAKAFGHTSAYDAAVSRYLINVESPELFPDRLILTGERSQLLRYGENPHQSAAAYRSASLGADSGILGARQLQGKELSFNNLLDADAAWACVRDVSAPCVSIIKHTIPCGLAEAADLLDAYRDALAGDPVSAFGGIVASNVPIDGRTAGVLGETFYEVVVAPGFGDEAVEILGRKKNLRLLEVDVQSVPDRTLELKTVSGGWLVQSADTSARDESAWEVVSERQPTDAEIDGLRFAWRAVRHVKSNAIVLAQGRAVVGVGSGQPNRVESVAIAVKRAGERASGAVMASDAFFPFPDGVETAAAAGVTAVIQPGGSMRDAEVIAAANSAGMAMIATGRRHFRH